MRLDRKGYNVVLISGMKLNGSNEIIEEKAHTFPLGTSEQS